MGKYNNFKLNNHQYDVTTGTTTATIQPAQLYSNSNSNYHLLYNHNNHTISKPTSMNSTLFNHHHHHQNSIMSTLAASSKYEYNYNNNSCT